ncbi:MAG TPA: hypothetical protein PKK10_06850 [Woeseiaceae bacterium]|nr:hypothetical protein [Woeseiaceae bacterium]
MRLNPRSKLVILPLALAMLSACASGIKITTIQPLGETADAPYEKILVVALADTFDPRRYLEKEVVAQLSTHGVQAVAATSMMDTRTPLVRQTFVDMVKKVNADAVLVTQVVSNDVDMTVKELRPEATYNVWPTYYYNVFAVQQAEYVQPPGLAMGRALVLATQVYSVASQQPVWGIEMDFKVVQEDDQFWDYTAFTDLAKAITGQMSRDRLITR